MTYLDALWLYDYAHVIPPRLAARNNNASGRKFILDCCNGAAEHWTSAEQAEMKPWVLEFLQENMKIEKGE